MPEGDSTWCDLHEIDHCSICKPKPVPVNQAPRFVRGDPRSMEARHGSTCPACENTIHPGDIIVPDEYDGWKHEGC